VPSKSTSNLLDDPSFVLSRVAQHHSIESWHIESFIRKLRSQETLKFSVSEVLDDSLSISASTSASKYFAWHLHTFSDTFKMLNPAAKDEDRISASDFGVCNLGHLSIALVIGDECVEQALPIIRPAIQKFESRLDRDDFKIDWRRELLSMDNWPQCEFHNGMIPIGTCL
jgi:hypothetical protein